MKADIKAQWVTALRSGKYHQGAGWLRRNDYEYQSDTTTRFCCLGVLCDLVNPKQWSSDIGGPVNYGPKHLDTLPSDHLLRGVGLKVLDAEELAHMNDTGKSFAQIADYIEREM